MKKILLNLAVLSVLGMGAAHAAPTVGAQGVINFTGSINADACVVHSVGPGGAGGSVLNYSMGSVSINSLGSESDPMTSATQGVTTLPVSVDLEIECVAGTSVELELKPQVASGKGIGVTGGAQGVQIMLIKDDTPLDFTTGSAVIDAQLQNGRTNVNLVAYYTLKANQDVNTVQAGTANGAVNYVLSYN